MEDAPALGEAVCLLRLIEEIAMVLIVKVEGSKPWVYVVRFAAVAQVEAW